MNRWKAAFFVALAAWLVTFCVGVYFVVDAALDLDDVREGYADCEVHRDFLHALAKGLVDRTSVRAVRPLPRSANGYTRSVGSSEVSVKYDAAGKYLASSFGASTTPK